MNPIPFIWTNDDIETGLHDKMVDQMAFLDRFGLKGTFFVVPCRAGTKPLTGDPKLVTLLKEAMTQGHDIQQHSTTHVCIENGTADLRMFDLMGDGSKVDYSEKRFLWERIWEVDAIKAQINWGRQIWIECFGKQSTGYRPGCGAFCGNMYKALEQLDFQWASARLVSMTGWMWQANHDDYPVRLEGPVKPFRQGKIIEYPILDDVAFRVPQDQVDRYVELGWQHWQACVKRQAPYILLCHPSGLNFDGGTGYAIHEKLLPRILESNMAIPMTLDEYHNRVVAGKFPLATPEQAYPDSQKLPAWHILSDKQKGNPYRPAQA